MLQYSDAKKEDEQCCLCLPYDTLRPLSIMENSSVDGIYYPPPEGRKKTGVKHDFMLTPIPYRFWPTIMRVRVRLIHEPGAIALVSECLADIGVSIMHGESTRSGHRYCSWNFVVSVEHRKSTLKFDNKTNLYMPIQKWTSKIRRALRKHAKCVLFVDKDDVRLRHPIGVWPLNSLAYFHHVTEKRRKRKKNGWIYKPFSLKCLPNGRLQGIGPAFDSILHHIRHLSATECVFAEMDTKDFNLRIGVILESRRRNFLRVSLTYHKTGTPDSTRGFLAHISKLLAPKYNLWSMNTHTQESQPASEVGGKHFLAEICGSRELNDEQARHEASALKSLLEGSPYTGEPDHKWTTRVDVRRLSVGSVESMIDSQPQAGDKRYDVFISYTKQDEDEAKKIETSLKGAGIRCYMAPSKIKTAQVFGRNRSSVIVIFAEFARSKMFGWGKGWQVAP